MWSAGNDVYLAGLNEDGTHHQTKHLHKEDYLPIGSIINMDGRKFRIDGVDFDKGKVSLQDMALADLRMPIFREEPLSVVRELYEQQDEALDAAPEKAVDYKVGDNVIVDLPTQTIEGTIGYVGETDVRIDTSAQGQSWDNEVINKQQFEEGLRQNEPNATRPVRTEKTVAVYPAKENNLPFDIVIQTISTESPTVEAEHSAPEPAGNFHITDDHLGEGGAKQKYARNIEAIRTLFKLEDEHRGATAEEQQVLSQYVGWGGLADAFDPGKDNWAKEYAELKGLLSEDEYAAARSSTLNAHYTSPTVIRSIYDAVERMGFHSGNILEPSMGVGNFFGMLPDTMQDSRLYGVELDSITGRIAKKLYPQADITVAGFETTDRRDFYDLAVGNVPFGQYKVNDKAYNKLGFSMLKEGFYHRPLTVIRPIDIENFLKGMRRDGRSDSYISKARGMLYQIFQKAEANDLVRRNPVRLAEKMRASGTAKRKEAFTTAEVAHLMKVLPDDRMGLSIRLLLGTGMRMQELLALEPQFIEEDGSVIHIRQAVKVVKGTVSIGSPKSKDSIRDIPVPLNVRPCAIKLRDTTDQFIWESPKTGLPCNPTHFRDVFRKSLEEAGDVRLLTPHSCRHTYVSQMQALGVDIQTIQSIVGHADTEMTEHYLHVQESIRQSAIQLFSEAFSA